ncbi:MAG: alpha/beta hydrolase [Novosphingobium sp.]|nr:alpha/beta hydrolase [Novosphingobium sp.]
MDTRHLVDPELLGALALLPPLDISGPGLERLRATMDGFGPTPEALACDDIIVQRLVVPATSAGPELGVILHRPADQIAPLPLYLHIHGGGFVLGNATMSSPANIALAREVGCLVASVDYRLSPEATGQQPVEDCYRALSWLVANAPSYGIDPSLVAVGGESAGGGLAASLALMVRDRGTIALALQMLICPMLDDRTRGEHPHCGEFVWTAESNTAAWSLRIGSEDVERDECGYIAAARAQNLRGLAPAYIAVGSHDLFLEEDIAYARRLARAGVSVDLHVYAGGYHGFELAADASITRRTMADRYSVLRRTFEGERS